MSSLCNDGFLYYVIVYFFIMLDFRTVTVYFFVMLQ